MTRIEELVTAARAGVENLSPEELAAELAREDVLLVDVREPDEVASGTLPGALAVPRGVLEFCTTTFGPARRVVLVSGAGARSALAAAALQGLGVRDVAHLAGGLRAWTAKGGSLASP